MDPAPELDPGRMLGWYRGAVFAEMARVAALSALLVVAGMLLIGLALWSGRVAGQARHGLALLGGAGILAGPLSLMLRWHRLLSREEYVAIHERGLMVASGGPPRFLPWGELQESVVGADGVVELRLAGGERVRLWPGFTGASPVEVVKALEMSRRRAGLGMLR